MTKIDRFVYDINTIIMRWRSDYPLTKRNTPKYYKEIITYVKEHIKGLEDE